MSCCLSSRDCAMPQSRAVAYQLPRRQPWSHRVLRSLVWIQLQFKITDRFQIFLLCQKSSGSSSWLSSLATLRPTTYSQIINPAFVDITPLRQLSSESSLASTLPSTGTKSPFLPSLTLVQRSTLWITASTRTSFHVIRALWDGFHLAGVLHYWTCAGHPCW